MILHRGTPTPISYLSQVHGRGKAFHQTLAEFSCCTSVRANTVDMKAANETFL